MFTLIELLNSLQNYRINVIDPSRQSEVRSIAIRPEIIHQEFVPRMKVGSLGVLLRDTENVNLLGRLVTAERQYHAIAHNIEKRSIMHTEVVQPALEATGLVEMEPVNQDTFRTALGPRVFTVMQRATDDIILAVDTSIENLRRLILDLNQAASEIFPRNGFLRLADDD